ncbi:hypothetical protein, partial [Rhodococcus sp. IEGM 1330]|uniref:hypothetical protein n=1 Tax=Rhodococcus sp. IEGM 1330 TaxID=3082225 RepID=UPI002952B94F
HIECIHQIKFGTDIHRHTVEFSKNTRTPFTSELKLVGVRGNRSSLDQMIEHSQTGFSSMEESNLAVQPPSLCRERTPRCSGLWSGLASVSL